MLCSVTSRFIIAATLQPGCSAASHAPSLVRALQQLENRVCLVGLQQQTHQDRSSLLNDAQIDCATSLHVLRYSHDSFGLPTPGQAVKQQNLIQSLSPGLSDVSRHYSTRGNCSKYDHRQVSSAASKPAAACGQQQLQPAEPLQQQQQQQQASQQSEQQQQPLRHAYPGTNSADSQQPLPPGPQQQSSSAVGAAPAAAVSSPVPLSKRPSAARRHLQQYLLSIDSSAFVDDLAAGIWAGNRLAISRSLTLCESTRPDHALQAAALLRKLIDRKQQQQVQDTQQEHSGVAIPAHRGVSGGSSSSSTVGAGSKPATGAMSQHPYGAVVGSVPNTSAGKSSAASPSHCVSSSLRIGLSGPPGAGKSSLIETLGCYLADHGSKVAVLAVDPSSAETGGAILGDKTRMARLSSHASAYVRPSPARGTLGGVTRSTYDAMLICESAGYDRVLVETVGVGQSEVAVADLVDCMILVMPPVGGDDLQMIKRGIMEVADVILVNKADGPTETAATRAASEYAGWVHLMPHRYEAWKPQVLPVSAHTGRGVPALARLISQFEDALLESGELSRSRTRRAVSVTWLNVEEQLLETVRRDVHVKWLLSRLMPCVQAGQMAPRSAADIVLSYFYQHCC